MLGDVHGLMNAIISELVQKNMSLKIIYLPSRPIKGERID